jgi:hypothetical protein
MKPSVAHNVTVMILLLITLTVAVCLASCTTPSAQQSLTLRVIDITRSNNP